LRHFAAENLGHMTLIQQIQGDDHTALSALYSTFEPLLLKYLEQQLGCKDTAAEITQRCFVKIFTRWYPA
jgi:DNA-directed RNA polymerase specialized sigma24 family protein